jgi:hypothetical protein
MERSEPGRTKTNGAGSLVTFLILVAPQQEIEIHGFYITCNSDVKMIEKFIKNKEAEYGQVDRILINGGLTQILDPKDGIPVPPVTARGT